MFLHSLGRKRPVKRSKEPALFQAGDGHAAQGNGEVDITALETYLSGNFRFIVHKNKHLRWPRAETPDYYISMGFSKD